MNTSFDEFDDVGFLTNLEVKESELIKKLEDGTMNICNTEDQSCESCSS